MNPLGYLVVSGILSIAQVHAAPMKQLEKSCMREIEKNVQVETDRLTADYAKRVGASSPIRPANGPRFLEGTNGKVVVLVHGFIASPIEVADLGRALRAQGYSVYMPLIPGFGSSTKVANSFSKEEWRATVGRAVDAVKPCFEHASLVGFSLGGGLVSDFALSSLDKNGAHSGVKVDSLTLVSPYYKAAIPGALLANSTISLLTKRANLAILYELSGKNPDLFAPLYSCGYNEDLPLAAVNQILQFGKILSKMDSSQKSQLPTLLTHSRADKTVDVDFAETFTRTHFPKTQVYEYAKNTALPHQLLLSSRNPHTKLLFDSISRFIGENAN